MRAINEIKADVKNVETIMNILNGLFGTNRTFRLIDIPEEKSEYKKLIYNVEAPYGYYLCPTCITGSTMRMLIRRGLLKIVGREEFIYKNCWNDSMIGVRHIYQIMGTVDDYRAVMTKALVNALS